MQRVVTKEAWIVTTPERKQRGNKSDVVEPRSYRDVLMNGEERKMMT